MSGGSGNNASPDNGDDEGLAPAVGPNLRRLRSKRGLSLERLSRRSGVSRAMLSQIELGQSAPTINLLWKVARALGVPFSALTSPGRDNAPVVLRARDGRMLTNPQGSFTSRALFPFNERRRSEFYEVRLKTGGQEEAIPQPPGTTENLVVSAGVVEIEVDHTSHRLEAGDAILFAADVARVYHNVGRQDAVLYLVVTHAEDVS